MLNASQDPWFSFSHGSKQAMTNQLTSFNVIAEIQLQQQTITQ